MAATCEQVRRVAKAPQRAMPFDWPKRQKRDRGGGRRAALRL